MKFVDDRHTLLGAIYRLQRYFEHACGQEALLPHTRSVGRNLVN